MEHTPIWAISSEAGIVPPYAKAHLHKEGYFAICGYRFGDMILPAASWDKRCTKCLAIDRKG